MFVDGSTRWNIQRGQVGAAQKSLHNVCPRVIKKREHFKRIASNFDGSIISLSTYVD